jgi:hypothetical protein
MTRNKQFAVLFAAFVFFSSAILVRAQAPTTPIVVKSKPAPSEKPIKAHFEVLHMMINAIQVRSLADEREIHTFIYSDQIRDRMQALFNNGGYQYGDKVEIYYMHGSDVAVNIKGKPSRPI